MPRSLHPTVYLFWLMSLGHAVSWTLVPFLTQPNAPLDTLEMLYWGHEWEWGYYKHPPLPAWIAETMCLLFGRSIWPTYVAAQICVITCFWAAWRLGREFLPPWPALCAAFLLEACYFYNFTTVELNNNVVSRTFWALSILFFYRALTRENNRWWIAAGGSIALGMLSKYDVAILAVTMMGFSVLHPLARQRWRTAGPYLGIASALVILMPHLLWLVANDFPTVAYFRSRSADHRGWASHVVNPLKFLASQLGAVLPIVLLATPLIAGWRLKPLASPERFRTFFLCTMVIGPIALIVALSGLLGFTVRSMWGTALWSYAGLLLLVMVPLREEIAASKRVLSLSVLWMGLFLVALGIRNTTVPHLRHTASRIHYPGQKLATRVDQIWRTVSDQPLSVVAGDWWPAANVAFYASSRASVYAGLDPAKSPWMTDGQFAESGGVIVWRPTSQDHDPVWLSVQRRFPAAVVHDSGALTWETSADIEPVHCRIALVPPPMPSQRTAQH